MPISTVTWPRIKEVTAMLVLSRKVGEEIMVGDCRITVIELQANRVRLGVEAPRDVPVHRKEVYDEIHRGESREP